MSLTICGHDAITSVRDPRLASAIVPGTKVRLTTHRDCLPLFVDLAKLLNADVEPLTWATWSYAFRAPRMGSGISSHAGYACDFWSNGIGQNTSTGPSKMPEVKARAMAATLARYRLPDGRYVFGWGAARRCPGVESYPGQTYERLNDPMHVFVSKGVTMADCRTVARMKRLAADGTWLGAA